MKAVVAAFNQEKALVGAFSVITNLRMELFQALVIIIITTLIIFITWARVLPRVSGSMTSPNTRATAATLLNRKNVPDRDSDWGEGEYIYTILSHFMKKAERKREEDDAVCIIKPFLN